MWFSFAVALMVGALFLYVPGYLVLRTVHLSRLASIACAPIVGVAAYAFICVAYDKLGVACSWASVFFPVLGVAVVMLAVSVALEWHLTGSFEFARGRRTLLGAPDSRRDAALLGFYFAIGVLFTTFLFIKGLDGSGSFVQELDNAHHLNAIRSFLDSGVWSSLSSSLYLADAPNVDPVPGANFYPSAWHDVAAMISSATGATVTQAVNATNSLFVGLVYPGCTFVLLRKIFEAKPALLVCGALAMVSFAAFPWLLLYWGPLYPNCASLCVFPAVAWLFMEATGPHVRRSARAAAGILTAVGVASVALLQPNAVFTAVLFLVPWCVHRVVEAVGSAPHCSRRVRAWQIAAGCGFVLFAAVVWAVLYNLPFFASVVSHTWGRFAEGHQALVNILTLSFRFTMVQIVLGVFVAIGFVRALRRTRWRWVAISYALACLFYYVCAVTDDPIKHWLTGFWYTDPVRLGANAALFGMPLAALGFAFVVEKVRGSFAKQREGFWKRNVRLAAPASIAAVLCVFAFVNFYPSYDLPGRGSVATAFGEIENQINILYNTTRVNVYAPREVRFVEKVQRAVPEGSVIINQPNDGSVFAYALDGLDVMYRRMRDYGGAGETDGSKLIRERLHELASDEEVRSAVEQTGATYVLQLDNPAYTDFPLGMQEYPVDPGHESYENAFVDPNEPLDLTDYRKTGGQDTYYLFSYVPDEWVGIDSIDDDTPGFEVVLREGDMRLYRIILDEENG